ncbi:ATP-binding cassette domain-containing protein [Croceicoccus bisphenolivorans]|uniref:ATP-binding cassette domain-containing protein n=1 Tax=Croceicoccus bisphenolivorans TaxID=1783232 RepID=UPI000835981B|nr:ABC transporter ATP-binding protein [Croceicoccus bisphenolivorans]
MNGPATTLAHSIPRARLAALVALMLGVALTEGAGILALVPMLAILGDGAAQLPDWLQPYAANIGIGPLLAFFVALVAGRAALQYALTLNQQKIQFALIDTWRSRVYASLVRASWRTLSSMRQSDNISLMVTSIDRLGYGFANLLQAIATCVTLFAIWAAALWLAPALALAAVVGGLVVIAGFIPLKRRAHVLGTLLGERYGQVHATLDDGLGAMRLIKSHGREAAAISTMENGITDLRRAQIAFQRATARSRAALHIGAAMLLAAIVAFAMAQGTSLAVLLPLIVLFGRSVPLLDGLQQAIQQWSHAAPALADAQALLAVTEADAEPALPPAPPVVPRGAIALVDAAVHHRGRDLPAADHVSLALDIGTTTALVGPSGAGKSTLADLFGGLVEADSGSLQVDRRALHAEEVVRWRGSVSYVHQEPVLFAGSIRENLLWAEPDAGEARLASALREAAAGFVFDLPDGLDMQVGDAGRKLSGGERQRIALARALLRDPALLILDEATSALDADSEAAIAEAVAAMQGHRTILIVAHRGLLTQLADRVVHMRDGRIEHIDDRRRERA